MTSGNLKLARKKLAARKALAKKGNKAANLDGRYVSGDDRVIPLPAKHTLKQTKLRKSIQPGSVLIVLSGRFRGARVVFLKQLESGLLLVTGPYKCNGVPVRRVNQAYVIATSTTVDISGVKLPEELNDEFFKRVAEPKKGEEGFFDLQEKINPKFLEVRKAMQEKVDTQVLAAVEKVPEMAEYLKTTFTLKKFDAPHLLKF